jgi:uncharacterized membrane protein YqiK
MADEGKIKRGLAAVATGAALGATQHLSNKLAAKIESDRAGTVRGKQSDEIFRDADRTDRQQRDEARMRDKQRVSEKRLTQVKQAPGMKDPTRTLDPEQSKKFRKYSEKQRLKRRAAKARARGIGGKLGVIGLATGIPRTVSNLKRIEAEGGPFAARFGKFIEGIVGSSSVHLPRPPTARERERARWL